MRERIRSHLSYANAMATIAVFIALGGGTTAVALSGSNTVQSDDLGPGAQVKAADVAANAVSGSSVLNGSLALGDLNDASRPHKLEFSVPDSTGDTTIATVGPVQVIGRCDNAAGGPQLTIRLSNLTNQTGTMNRMFTDQTASGGPVTVRAAGEFVGAGSQGFVDASDGGSNSYLAAGSFNRVEGQVVFQTPGRVTTIPFHAFTAGPVNDGHCEFYGTAVTSNVS